MIDRRPEIKFGENVGKTIAANLEEICKTKCKYYDKEKDYEETYCIDCILSDLIYDFHEDESFLATIKEIKQ